ncbi:MAG: Nif3-like dinuclear metal center hexameric protein [Candidatus Cloacimonadota bacterium]|nr:Nif3-like dinuclear metal center hexameric protein [Candidatus Cloacimonadota bacterium]
MSEFRDEIVEFCNDFLKVDDFKDYCRNGLQVEGKTKIKKIVIGVSLSEKFIKSAISQNADMLMVHHGLFSNQFGKPPRITGILRNRLKLLIENDINLCGYHLPLDANPKIGNNISLLEILGLKKIKAISTVSYGEIGFIGKTKEPISFEDFVEKVNNELQTDSYFIKAGSDFVEKVGIISGGASNNYADAITSGADTYLCGEIQENVVREVEEAGINFINAGHYNSEKLGIKNLGKLVEKKFDVSVDYIDIPNVV